VARQAVTVRYSSIAPTLAARANSRTRVIERDMQRFSRPNVQGDRRAATDANEEEAAYRRVRLTTLLGRDSCTATSCTEGFPFAMHDRRPDPRATAWCDATRSHRRAAARDLHGGELW